MFGMLNDLVQDRECSLRRIVVAVASMRCSLWMGQRGKAFREGMVMSNERGALSIDVLGAGWDRVRSSE